MNSVRWIFSGADKGSYQDKLYTHNQKEIYLNYIIENYKSISEYKISEFKKRMENSSEELKNAIIENQSIIGGSIERQTELMLEQHELLSYQLGDISTHLVEISNILNLGFNNLIEIQRVANQYLFNIQILSGLPEDEKRRNKAFEKGMRHLSNAVNYDKELYSDAYRELLIAKSLDPTDYFVLYALGLIHLNSKNKEIYNVEQAKDYFVESARRANIDLKENAAIQKNFNRGYISQNIFGQAFSISEITTQAFQSSYHAAFCYYILQKTEEARKYVEDCLKLIPNSGVGLYMLAKIYFQQNDELSFIKNLESAILSDPQQSIEASEKDEEILNHPAVKKLLARMRDDAHNKANKQIQELEINLLPKSQGIELLNKIRLLVKEEKYLQSLYAMQLMDEKNKYKFEESIELDNDGNWIGEIFNKEYDFTLSELFKHEMMIELNFEKVKLIVEYNHQIEELANKISNQSSKLTELKKHIEQNSNGSGKGIGCLILTIAPAIIGLILFFSINGLSTMTLQSALLLIIGAILSLAGVYFFINIGSEFAAKIIGDSQDKNYKNSEYQKLHIELNGYNETKSQLSDIVRSLQKSVTKNYDKENKYEKRIDVLTDLKSQLQLKHNELKSINLNRITVILKSSKATSLFKTFLGLSALLFLSIILSKLFYLCEEDINIIGIRIPCGDSIGADFFIAKGMPILVITSLIALFFFIRSKQLKTEFSSLEKAISNTKDEAQKIEIQLSLLH